MEEAYIKYHGGGSQDIRLTAPKIGICKHERVNMDGGYLGACNGAADCQPLVRGFVTIDHYPQRTWSANRVLQRALRVATSRLRLTSKAQTTVEPVEAKGMKFNLIYA